MATVSEYSGKARALTFIALAQIAALSVWFSAAAALPDMITSAALSPLRQAALTSAVQIGFVAGALTSALLGLADRVEPRRLFATGAGLAALANLMALALDPGSAGMIATRFLAGFSLAACYPVGMKLAASWARGDAGLLVGLLVGALTLGSALPFMFAAANWGIAWHWPFLASAAAALLAAVLIQFGRGGPGLRPAPAFRFGAASLAWKAPALRLANLGYLGHMWELYALWAWIGPFCHAYWHSRTRSTNWADITAFSVVAIGALACLLAGRAADRHGRTTITMIAMGLSGSCALASGFLFHTPPIVMIPLLLLWGMAVIADSAQFSASIAELSPPEWTGTLLTIQTAMGFALTALIVQLLPLWIGFAGWEWAFAPLAIGPLLGVWAMARLRAQPEAVKLAGGRR
ncbi:MFS transporter [Maricaulis parjimensis]|uniref:MFS transporter n=1 Tax=Maricaulis parjimensis TaxID=144023 RepID=UPI001939803B|nr:MFS transporter [Maricaulis parjimensis]